MHYADLQVTKTQDFNENVSRMKMQLFIAL